MSEVFAAYLPQDRRTALAQGVELPARRHGTLLFADISGFTPLTERLVQTLGPRRGAEALTRLLNDLYTQIIVVVDKFDGSVIGFSGDAITCWFAPHEANRPEGLGACARRAHACARGVQAAVASRAEAEVAGGIRAALAVKIAIASGPVRRFVVGDPAVQLIDVVAGAAVDEMARLEAGAEQGAIVLDEATERILDQGNPVAASTIFTDRALAPLAEVMARPWVHPVLQPMIRSGQERYLAELRPAVALFVRFGGLEFESDPDADHKLDSYVRWVQAVVARHEGLLIQLTTGDKGSYLYAAFGAPVAHDDDLRRALSAALDLIEPPGTMPFIRTTQIGVSAGQMRVGAYGSATRRTYGVLGDEVNVAARLMTLAQPAQILIPAQLAARASEGFICEPVQSAHLKGKAAALALHAVTGRREASAGERLGRIYANPLVGREREAGMMEAELQAAIAGQGKLVRVEGPAGIGKSHLMAAMVERARALNVRTVSAACQTTTHATPYAAARSWVSALLTIEPDQMARAKAQHELSRALAALEIPAPERAPLLGDLLGIRMADTDLTAGLDARQRQGALVSLVDEIVQASARRRALLLAADDAQWMDEASQQILRAILRGLAGNALLVLLLHRPPEAGEESQLVGGDDLPPHHHLRLGELDGAAVARLLESHLGAPFETLAVQLIGAQAQGNPFFSEELAVALRESGRLELTEGFWRLTAETLQSLHDADCLVESEGGLLLRADAPLAEVELGIPGSVQGVVLARLDRLPDLARFTLKVASVVGPHFPLPLLQHVRTLATQATLVPHALEQCVERDFVRRVQGSESHYLFKHNIIREVAYTTLLEEQQREIHEHVAEALEATDPGALEQIAQHYVRSDLQRDPLRAKAHHYLGLAGQRAQRDYANETALSYYRRASELAENAELDTGLAEVLHLLGRRADERAVLERLRLRNDADPVASALLWGDYHEAIGDYPEALLALERALDAAQERNELRAAARALVRTGMVTWRQGEYNLSEAAFERALALLGHEGAPAREEEADAWYGLGLVYRQTGQYDRAESAHHRDLSLRRALNRRAGEARTLNALGHLESLRQNYRPALAWYEQALAIRRAIGEKSGIGASLLSVAQARLSLGEFAEAELLYQHALRIQQETQNRWEQASIWNELGILRWMVGQYERAMADLEHGMQIAAEIQAQASHAYLLCNVGQVQRDSGALAEAAATLRHVIELARTYADPNLEAICHSDLALTLVRMGEWESALEHCTQAERLFVELEQPASLPTVGSSRARALLARGDARQARAVALQTLDALDDAGSAANLPQRDYLHMAQVLESCGERRRAAVALARARALVLENAARITSAEMRATYLAIDEHSVILATTGTTS